jgi:Cu(I)/Ag(I) efflux system membrane protein CusA/SilA
VKRRLSERWLRPPERDPDDPSGRDLTGGGAFGGFFRLLLMNRVLAVILVVGLAVFGASAYDDVPVDAIPDISENQVVVYTPWPGRSPKDVEDQVTYPLAVALQGIPAVYDVRSISGFGFSQIYVVFDDGTDIYWARSRVLERLNVAQRDLPADARSGLGPDATSLGQIFWYTVDSPDGSHDLAELRSIQDWTIRYALQTVKGVAEVASVGGFVQEYQVDAHPHRLRAHGVGLGQLAAAVRRANLDVGAKVVETAGTEYVIRGVGFIKELRDLEETVVVEREHVPIRVRDVATVTLGPAFRRGALADEKGELVGGVATMRYGANPLRVIARIKEALDRLRPSLPDGVVVRPFYDRTLLVQETQATLVETLQFESLITVVVILLFLLHIRSSLLVALTLPTAVLLSFVAMRVFGIDANIMSLAGIAIAIGTMVDMGIVITENIHRHLTERPATKSRRKAIHEAASEVGGAVFTAIATTVVSFLPVFLLTDQEGKLFRPLAWTKSFALVSALIVSVTLVPVLAHFLLKPGRVRRRAGALLAGFLGGVAGAIAYVWADGAVAVPGSLVGGILRVQPALLGVAAGVVVGGLAFKAMREPLTPLEDNPVARGVVAAYAPVLRWVLRHKRLFTVAPVLIVLWGAMVWLGAGTVLRPVGLALEGVGIDPQRVRPLAALEERFPGVGREFMPPLDEGGLLFMPSILPHGSLNQSIDVMIAQNRGMMEVPEVVRVVGKAGRAETALDPAPVGMVETVLVLKPRHEWRPGLTKAGLIAELRSKTDVPGVAPSWLQPIETRIVMLQSGIKASIGQRIFGPTPEAIERATLVFEKALQHVSGAADVTALRLMGKPYLEVRPNRERMARYGLRTEDVQRIIEVAIGGMPQSRSVEGRERYPIRVRYARSWRDDIETIRRTPVPAGKGAYVPLSAVADFEIVAGPAMIRGEGGQLVGYVMFNAEGRDEVGLVEEADAHLRAMVDRGEIDVPEGVYWDWRGRYQNQVRATKRLSLLIPLCLLINLLLHYLHFGRIGPSLIVFLGIPVAFAGGFILLDFYGSYLTVAVWVGFIAVLGIAADDGIVIGTYIQQVIARRKPTTVAGVRAAVLEAGRKRIRPALMTSVTTILALLPIFLTEGRGSDVMRPMALPSIGGMVVAAITWFVVPMAYSAIEERRVSRAGVRSPPEAGASRAPGTPDPVDP